MADRYSYLAKNTFIFTISSFGSKLLAFLMVPFYTSVLTTAEYGTADMITTSSNLLIFVVTICISDSVLRFAISNKENRSGIFRFGLKVVSTGNLIFGIIMLVIMEIDPFKWGVSLYYLLFFTVLANSLNQLASNYLGAIDRINQVAVMGILVTVITIVCNLVFLLVFKLGVNGYLLSFIIGFVISTVYGFLIILRNDNATLRYICDQQTKKEMIIYSLPLILNGLAWWLNSSLDRYFIVYYHGVELNGLYAAASKIPTILIVISQIFNQAWNISAIKEYESEDKGIFFKNIYTVYNFVLIFGCSILVICNIPLAKILFAKDFFEAWQYSSILLISAVFSALSGVLGGIIAAAKESKFFALSTVSAAIVNIVLNMVLIPVYGGTGAAVATAVSFFVIWLIRYLCVAKYNLLKNNPGREILSYILITVQVVFEHMRDRFYIGQIIVLLLILCIYRNEMKKVILVIKNLIRRMKG